MLKKSSLRSFIWCYSFFFCFCRFWVIHSLNHFSLLVKVSVSILSLPTERYKSKDISIMTRATKKWTKSYGSLRRAHFHHINIFFLEVFLACKNPKAPWMVSTTVSTRIWGHKRHVCWWSSKFTCANHIFINSLKWLLMCSS